MESLRKDAALETQRKDLIDRLSKPSGVSDQAALERVSEIIKGAVRNGLTEVQVYRFPNSMCTDRGRAINQQEKGWGATLTGVPKEILEFYTRHLQPKGYKLQVKIIDYPDGVPGDVGMTLKWS